MDQVDRVPWEGVLKDKAVHRGQTFFKNDILKALEQSILMLKEKLVGKKTNLSEQRVSFGTKEK